MKGVRISILTPFYVHYYDYKFLSSTAFLSMNLSYSNHNYSWYNLNIELFIKIENGDYMKKTIGILAHVDAGKTTFAEQILYHTNVIRNIGRVDHKNSFLDSHNIERQRGITVFSDQAKFEIGKSTYYLIDTPGHIDFSCEMERAISIMDYAIIIVSAVEGVQAHTETVVGRIFCMTQGTQSWCSVTT